MSTGFIFPAFISEYLGDEPKILGAYSEDFSQYLNEASLHLSIDLNSFSVDNMIFIDNELNAQYISYIFGCSLSNILKYRLIDPSYIAGYSMGLYACLYCGEAITFKQGLDLIRKAYDLIKETTDHLEAGMGSIVGLSRKDINELIKDNISDVQIVNKNGTHSFLLSGIKPAIIRILEVAKADGALHTAMLNVKSPYHTRLLDQASVIFAKFITENIQIEDSSYKIISTLDRRTFQSASEIQKELVDNLNSNIDWLETMEKMIGSGINQFIECGAGNSLFRIGKFIKGDFKIYTVNNLDKIISDSNSGH